MPASTPIRGSVFTYALLDNAGGRFAIDASTGVIRVADGASLDFETASSLGISVRVTDQTGLSLDKSFTINVSDVNEAPTNALLSADRLRRIRLPARSLERLAASIPMRVRC